MERALMDNQSEVIKMIIKEDEGNSLRESLAIEAFKHPVRGTFEQIFLPSQSMRYEQTSFILRAAEDRKNWPGLLLCSPLLWRREGRATYLLCRAYIRSTDT